MRLQIRSVLSFFATLLLVPDLGAAQAIGGVEHLPPHQRWSGGPVYDAQLPRLPDGMLDVRMEPAASWSPTQAPVFVPIPEMSASFVAAADDTNLGIVFSAEARTNVTNKRLFVRALVDGVVSDPSDVVFTEGGFGGARSFVFTGVVDAGIHTVEMQWLVDPGASAELRATSLMLRHGREQDDGGSVTHHTPPSGSDDVSTISSWVPVPGGSVPFYLPEGARTPIVAFSAETHVAGANKRLFVRARVGGTVCSPGDVVFAQRASRQTHTMRFEGPDLAPGWHTATIDWLIDPGGVASMGDRTILVTAFPQSSVLRHDLVVAPSGPALPTSSSSWSQVPNLSALVPLPDNAEIAVSFSGEVMGDHGASLEMRLVADGEVIAEETATLTGSGFPFETNSFTFDRKHVFLPPATLTGIWLEWRAIGGQVWVGDRVMELVVEKGLVPDLAEAPPIGGNDPVEAVIGTRKVLTIIHRIPRAAPNHVIPTVAQVSDALYGAGGVADYYDTISGGRLALQSAGVVAVDALKTEDHYWNHDPFDCGQPLQDGYTGGHAERWAEAITLASATVDFASFDTDENGVVDLHELGILIIVPQGAENGFVRALNPFCAGNPFMTDGVVMPAISEVFTSNPGGSEDVMAHELAHLLLRLGDMYANGFDFDTEAGSLSLMGNNFGTTSHIDGVQKLALGWATPKYAPFNDTYLLQDVKQSGEVVILPRDQDGDGKEFFLLEVRRSSTNDPLYDTWIGANGVVVWHSVEEAAQNANPPGCESVADWNNVTSNLRRGVRVIRPGIVYAGGSASSWDVSDYDLIDVGLTCPPAVPQNALRWADGTASGWRLRDLSPAAALMTVEVEVP